MFNDLISRAAALDAISTEGGCGMCARRVLDIPAVDAVPVVHGRWGENGDCSECGFQPWYERDIHTLLYCPNCGAKMDEEARS